MSRTVLMSFRDRHDGLFHYDKGDQYPREGYAPTKERVKFLEKRGYIGPEIKQKEVKTDVKKI